MAINPQVQKALNQAKALAETMSAMDEAEMRECRIAFAAMSLPSVSARWAREIADSMWILCGRALDDE